MDSRSPRRARRRLVAWVGSEPHRVDVAWVDLGARELRAHGTSTCANYTLAYRLVTTASWVSRALDVTTDGAGWRRTLRLRRSTDGRWSARRQEFAAQQLISERDVELPDLRDALDCDLGLCPLTNTMPILRGDLIAHAQKGLRDRAAWVMAWVSVPDLRVEPSVQIYEPGPPVVGGGARIDFSAGDFAARIEVDRDGLVVDYPGIGRRLEI